MAWLRLIPAWGWLSIVLGLWTVVEELRLANLRGELVAEQAAHSGYRAEVAERDRRAAMAVLAENQRRQKAADESRREALGQIEQAQADAAAADRIAGGLRAELNRIRGLIASYSGAPDGSQAGRSTADLLADLLEEVEREGRAMAAEADRRGVAGAACERQYDALLNAR